MTSTYLHSLAIDPVTPTYVIRRVPVVVRIFTKPRMEQTTGCRIGVPLVSVFRWRSIRTTIRQSMLRSRRVAAVFSRVSTGRYVATGWLESNRSHASFVSASPHTSGLLYAADQRRVSSRVLMVVITGPHTLHQILRENRFRSRKSIYTSIYCRQFSIGIFKSTDNGQTWIRDEQGSRARRQRSALAIDPLNAFNAASCFNVQRADDAFVTKINPAGSALIYSTLIGGTSPSADSPNVNARGFCDSDRFGWQCLYHRTAARRSFPTTPNTFQPINRGFTDAFIAKLV